MRWILAAIIIFILLAFFSGRRSLFKLYFLHQEKENLKQQREQLLKQNKQIQEEIKKLKTDDKYIEKIAREKYNMKKKDEEIYIIEPK